jgi:ABC-type taurine transport system ATPase subunit
MKEKIMLALLTYAVNALVEAITREKVQKVLIKVLDAIDEKVLSTENKIDDHILLITNRIRQELILIRN